MVWERMVSGSGLPRTASGGYTFVSFNRRLLTEGAYFFGRSHRSVEDQPLPPDTHTVTILRDPVARVHSYFDYLVAGDAEGTPRPVSPRERAIAGAGFDAFLDSVPSSDLLAQIETFSTRMDVNEALDQVAACSSVLFTETYAEDLANLAARLDLPLKAQRARVTGTRSTLDASQLDRLRTLLEPEYEWLRRLTDDGIVTRGSSG